MFTSQFNLNMKIPRSIVVANSYNIVWYEMYNFEIFSCSFNNNAKRCVNALTISGSFELLAEYFTHVSKQLFHNNSYQIPIFSIIMKDSPTGYKCST